MSTTCEFYDNDVTVTSASIVFCIGHSEVCWQRGRMFERTRLICWTRNLS